MLSMVSHLKELTHPMLLLHQPKSLLMVLLLTLTKLTSKDKLDSLKINLKMLHKLELKNQKLANKLKQHGKHKLKKSNKLLMLNSFKT